MIAVRGWTNTRELQPETLGLVLGEAKALLAGVSRAMVTQQTEAYLAQHATCAQCGTHRQGSGGFDAGAKEQDAPQAT